MRVGLIVGILIVFVIIFTIWWFYDPLYKGCALDCNNMTILESMKQHYNTLGPFRGSYNMFPKKTAKTGLNQCDVLYDYKPTEARKELESGEDYRRFTLDTDANCNWSVLEMGPHKSGIEAR
jgi:hypothetical protein